MKSNPQRAAPRWGEGRSSRGRKSLNNLAAIPASRVKRWSSLLSSTGVLSVFLGGVVFWVFLPVVRYDFVNLDDLTYVTANYHVQPGLTKEGLRWAFTGFHVANWHPVTWVSHMLDCQLFGLKPGGHHLMSALLHAANSVLLFLFLKAFTGAPWRCLAVAALFGLHPLRAESVAWISERKDVLSGLFFILTLWAYARYARTDARIESPGSKVEGQKSIAALDSRRSTLNYCLALIFFALGLMSKPMLVTVPFLLLLLDYWPLDRFEQSAGSPRPSTAVPRLSFWRLVAEKAPFFCLSIAACVVTFLAQKQGGTIEPTTGFRFLFRVENAAAAYLCYVEKLFYPVNLAVFYPRPGHWPVAIVVFALLLIAGMSGFAFAQRRRRPYFLVGWFWFLGTLIPVIGLVQVGTQAMADRYTYIPCIGILISLVWALADLPHVMPLARALVPAASIAAIASSVALTSYQLGFWRNSETLFRHALQVTKDNYVAHDSMGDVLTDQGRIEEAKEQYLEALRLSPAYVAAHNNLGLLLVREGKVDDAIAHYEEALKTSPENPEALINLGNALYRKGSVEQSITCFQRALAADPSHPQAHENLGRVLFIKGNAAEAIAHFREALRIKPDYAMAHHNLAIALLSNGHPDEAIEHLKEAVRLEPDLIAARSVLGAALASNRSLQEAESQFREVLRLKPQDLYALNNLGAILIGEGRLDEAVSELGETVRLYPEDADAHLNLGRALASQGKSEAAITELRTVARLRPGDKRVEQSLQALTAAGGRTNGP
jgi:Flp pilus assembly protein TadD